MKFENTYPFAFQKDVNRLLLVNIKEGILIYFRPIRFLKGQNKFSFSYQFFDKFNTRQFVHCPSNSIGRRMDIRLSTSSRGMTKNTLND